MSDYTYQLVVQTGPQTGEVYNLTQDLIVLGREPVSDIVVNDLEVSRQHARLTRSGSGYTIQDMGSTNGTFLDGKRLSGEPVPVVAGQMVAVGSNVTLLFMAVAAGAAATDAAAVAEAAVAEAAVAEAAVADVASGTVLELPEADLPPDLPLSLSEEEFIPDPLGTVAFSEPESEKPESLPEPLADAAAKGILESRPLPVFRFDEEKVEPEPARQVEPEALLLPNFSVEALPEAPRPESDYGSYRPTPPAREPAVPPAGNDKKRRNITIIVVVLAIIICCCCGFALVMYYWLGDILLEMMGYTAALFPWLLS